MPRIGYFARYNLRFLIYFENDKKKRERELSPLYNARYGIVFLNCINISMGIDTRQSYDRYTTVITSIISKRCKCRAKEPRELRVVCIEKKKNHTDPFNLFRGGGEAAAAAGESRFMAIIFRARRNSRRSEFRSIKPPRKQ